MVERGLKFKLPETPTWYFQFPIMVVHGVAEVVGVLDELASLFSYIIFIILHDGNDTKQNYTCNANS